MTFPGGTHDLWIRYWLAAGGIDPDKDVSTIVVPPPQMVANMKVGNMDAFCVGEPWNEQLVNQGIGFTAATTGEICGRAIRKRRSAMRADLGRQESERRQGDPDGGHGSPAMVRRHGEQGGDGRRSSASAQWFNVPAADIVGRLKGDIDYGNGRVVDRAPTLYMKFWKRPRVLSVQEPRHLVPGREHPLGQVRARHRHQGAGRQGQPRGSLARGGQGPRRRRSRHSGLDRRAASRPSSTARSSIRTTRPPISTASRSRRRPEPAAGAAPRAADVDSTETLHMTVQAVEKRRVRVGQAGQVVAFAAAAKRSSTALRASPGRLASSVVPPLSSSLVILRRLAGRLLVARRQPAAADARSWTEA